MNLGLMERWKGELAPNSAIGTRVKFFSNLFWGHPITWIERGILSLKDPMAITGPKLDVGHPKGLFFQVQAVSDPKFPISEGGDLYAQATPSPSSSGGGTTPPPSFEGGGARPVAPQVKAYDKFEMIYDYRVYVLKTGSQLRSLFPEYKKRYEKDPSFSKFKTRFDKELKKWDGIWDDINKKSAAGKEFEIMVPPGMARKDAAKIMGDIAKETGLIRSPSAPKTESRAVPDPKGPKGVTPTIPNLDAWIKAFWPRRILRVPELIAAGHMELISVEDIDRYLLQSGLSPLPRLDGQTLGERIGAKKTLQKKEGLSIVKELESKKEGPYSVFETPSESILERARRFAGQSQLIYTEISFLKRLLLLGKSKMAGETIQFPEETQNILKKRLDAIGSRIHQSYQKILAELEAYDPKDPNRNELSMNTKLILATGETTLQQALQLLFRENPKLRDLWERQPDEAAQGKIILEAVEKLLEERNSIEGKADDIVIDVDDIKEAVIIPPPPASPSLPDWIVPEFKIEKKTETSPVSTSPLPNLLPQGERVAEKKIVSFSVGPAWGRGRMVQRIPREVGLPGSMRYVDEDLPDLARAASRSMPNSLSRDFDAILLKGSLKVAPFINEARPFGGLHLLVSGEGGVAPLKDLPALKLAEIGGGVGVSLKDALQSSSSFDVTGHLYLLKAGYNNFTEGHTLLGLPRFGACIQWESLQGCVDYSRALKAETKTPAGIESKELRNLFIFSVQYLFGSGE